MSAEEGDIGLVLGVEAVRAPNTYQPLQICQWAFGAKAGHPLLARMLDFIVYRQASCSEDSPSCSARPGQPTELHNSN